MLDEYLYHQQPRNKRRFDLRDLLGPVIGGVAVTYLTAIALVGLLAR